MNGTRHHWPTPDVAGRRGGMPQAALTEWLTDRECVGTKQDRLRRRVASRCTDASEGMTRAGGIVEKRTCSGTSAQCHLISHREQTNLPSGPAFYHRVSITVNETVIEIVPSRSFRARGYTWLSGV